MHFKGSAEFMEGYGVGVGFKSSLNKYAHSNPSNVSTVFPSHTHTHTHTHTIPHHTVSPHTNHPGCGNLGRNILRLTLYLCPGSKSKTQGGTTVIHSFNL